ncbi:MAG TPA: gephyrin-like molybdotransferase Glp [Longimicrobiales bacterium]|nr:gephyrin-like molybdotransferase Glp [Longimicrobiales bacterium]
MSVTRREPDWLGVPEALEAILAAVAPTDVEMVALSDAALRVIAGDVRAPMAHPPWSNSAMDGFAVRSVDVRGATPERPVRLRVIEHVPAGGFPSRPVGAGEATRVMTGAPIPDGADGVIRVEHTSAWEDADAAGEIEVLRDDDAGRNLRARGEDYAEGDALIERGSLLTPARIGLLAAIGAARVDVHARPRVGILATGDELADDSAFDEVRAGRRIADSNSPALSAAVEAAGTRALRLGIAHDDLRDIGSRIERARGLDVLLVTAGASVGDHDLVKDALDAAGYAPGFWRVRMRPGSPVSFGRIGRTLVFGLPGNPVSALVTFHVLVAPALRALQGRSDVHSPVLRVHTAEPVPTRAGLAHFLRVRIENAAEGPPRARLTGPQGSGILTSMGRADALLIVPEDLNGLAADVPAEALPLHDPLTGRPTFGYTTVAVAPAAGGDGS